MPDAVIIDAVRTPIGALGGSLASVRPDDLAALVLKAIVDRSVLDPAIIEEVYMGCANQAGEDNRNVARMASLLAGIPVDVPAVTFNRLCASGLTAVNQAMRAIKIGEGEVYIAGGVESMSRAPYSVPKGERAYPWGNLTMWDTTLGLRYPKAKMKEMYGTDPLGETAENIYDMTSISREEQDAFALDSNLRAVAAADSGKFSEEIIPVTIPRRKGDPIIFDTDERPRRDTSMEALCRLRPRAGLTIDDIGLVELNEAFAVQALAVMKELGLRQEITNVNGGAIALGHPLGCSGARILTTLLHEMKRRAESESRPYYGLATLCVGVGQGESTIVEWMD